MKNRDHKLDDYKINVQKVANKITTLTEEDPSSTENQMQQLFGISEEVMQKYYSVALKLLEEKRWEDARNSFLFLTFVNAEIYNFWLGLGIAEQSLQHFDDAVIAYDIAKTIQPEDPVTCANLYQCLCALGQTREAEDLYEQAIRSCGDLLEHASLKQRLINYKKQVS